MFYSRTQSVLSTRLLVQMPVERREGAMECRAALRAFIYQGR